MMMTTTLIMTLGKSLPDSYQDNLNFSFSTKKRFGLVKIGGGVLGPCPLSGPKISAF